MPYLRGTARRRLRDPAGGRRARALDSSPGNRRDCAALRAVGFTGGQLDGVTAVQAIPFALGALLLGIPIGILVGRRAYARFAQSLAVVDETTTSLVLVATLAVAVLLAVAVGGLVAVAVARRSRGAAMTPDTVAWRR